MNINQAQNTMLPVASNGGANLLTNASNSKALAIEKTMANSDHYSATAANEAVVARVISTSIDKSLSKSTEPNETPSALSTKMMQRFSTQIHNDELAINMQSVTANVVSFVESALANLAHRNFDKEQLSFFKNEAITGVKVGIDLAKLDLVGMANDAIFNTIDDTKDSILGGINALSVEPFEYKSTASYNAISGEQGMFSAISLNTSKHELINVNFDSKAFNNANGDNDKSTYTTSSSNISFALQGNSDELSRQKIADIFNKIDGLTNSFYRGEVESAYNKSVELGYNDSEIISLAKQLNKSDTFQQMKMYGEIQHLESVREQNDFAAPKAVADYVNRYLDVIESSKFALNTEKDFNQVINGLVNQMKDVQVPDLLQAINRFHAFNNKFSQAITST
jgi:hypothetical protein